MGRWQSTHLLADSGTQFYQHEELHFAQTCLSPTPSIRTAVSMELPSILLAHEALWLRDLTDAQVPMLLVVRRGALWPMNDPTAPVRQPCFQGHGAKEPEALFLTQCAVLLGLQSPALSSPLRSPPFFQLALWGLSLCLKLERGR